MGLFGAMTTAVGGLRAQAFALENVSGNIANSQTTGFKRVDTSFSDLVPNSVPQLQLAGGVIARSRGTNNVQGDIQNASVDTFMAINGDGYFVVQKPSGFPDGVPVFTGVDLLLAARRLPARQGRLSSSTAPATTSRCSSVDGSDRQRDRQRPGGASSSRTTSCRRNRRR